MIDTNLNDNSNNNSAPYNQNQKISKLENLKSIRISAVENCIKNIDSILKFNPSNQNNIKSITLNLKNNNLK